LNTSGFGLERKNRERCTERERELVKRVKRQGERESRSRESRDRGREIDVAYEAVIWQTQHSELKVWQPF
jgi:hypothetical protein